MSSALIAPTMETFPNRYRWTTEACYRLMELGAVECRFELLDGEIIDKMGQSPQHVFGIWQLVHWASAACGFEFVRSQCPVSMRYPDNLSSEPEPDVAVTRASFLAYRDKHPSPEDLHLIVEVSDTTLQTDLGIKARLYARAEIGEYWVLDIASGQLHVHRAPLNGEYSSLSVHDEASTVAPLCCPDALLSASELLPPVAV